jgi:hypothetical protein
LPTTDEAAIARKSIVNAVERLSGERSATTVGGQ